jgi:hypothetical protein
MIKTDLVVHGTDRGFGCRLPGLVGLRRQAFDHGLMCSASYMRLQAPCCVRMMLRLLERWLPGTELLAPDLLV